MSFYRDFDSLIPRPVSDAISKMRPPSPKVVSLKINLATAHPIDTDTLGLALVVGGQTKAFTISRTSAASLAGRIAEALAK